MSRRGELKTTHAPRVGAISFEIRGRHGYGPGLIPKSQRFEACVWIGSKNAAARRSNNSLSCMRGSNPRRALAAALRSLAKSKLGARRKGAFKGRR